MFFQHNFISRGRGWLFVSDSWSWLQYRSNEMLLTTGGYHLAEMEGNLCGSMFWKSSYMVRLPTAAACKKTFLSDPQLPPLATLRRGQLPSQIQKETQILDVALLLLTQFVPVKCENYRAKWFWKTSMPKNEKKKTRFFDITPRGDELAPSLFQIRESGWIADLLLCCRAHETSNRLRSRGLRGHTP